MSDQLPAARDIDVRIRTTGGHEYQLHLSEDAPELRELFTAFVNRAASGATDLPGLVQLPLESGNAACSVAADHIVSIVTSPPVVLQLEQEAPAPAREVEPPKLYRPPCVVIDDFLGVDEHQDILALALRDRQRFEPGTVEGKANPHRQNWVIMDFGGSAHGTLLANRLLVWFPLVAQALGEEVFPLKLVESQLTAGNDRDYYKSHRDTDGNTPDFRAIACVYYFFREPMGFHGGGLRLYDAIDYGGQIRQAESFRDIEPVSNRLVAFTCKTFHELLPIRCPSKDFEDSRFAVTMWLHRSGKPDPDATFGWGHFHCGEVPTAFRSQTRPALPSPSQGDLA